MWGTEDCVEFVRVVPGNTICRETGQVYPENENDEGKVYCRYMSGRVIKITDTFTVYINKLSFLVIYL